MIKHRRPTDDTPPSMPIHPVARPPAGRPCLLLPIRSHCRVVERKETEEPTMGVEIETITPGDGKGINRI